MQVITSINLWQNPSLVLLVNAANEELERRAGRWARRIAIRWNLRRSESAVPSLDLSVSDHTGWPSLMLADVKDVETVRAAFNKWLSAWTRGEPGESAAAG